MHLNLVSFKFYTSINGKVLTIFPTLANQSKSNQRSLFQITKKIQLNVNMIIVYLQLEANFKSDT